MLLVPGAPEIEELESTTISITVTWMQNSKDGDAATITSYEISSSSGNIQMDSVSAATITGLSSNQMCTITIAAVTKGGVTGEKRTIDWPTCKSLTTSYESIFLFPIIMNFCSGYMLSTFKTQN